MTQSITIQITDTAIHACVFESKRRRRVRNALFHHGITVPFFPQERDDLVPLGESLCDWLRTEGLDHVSSRLIIPSSWALMHPVPLTDPRANDQAAVYEFERFIPVELERLTCASVRLEPDNVLVVGVCTAALAGLLESLEARGVQVQAVAVDIACVTALENPAKTSQHHGAVVLDERRMAIAVRDARGAVPAQLRSFALAPSDTEALWKRHFTMTSASTASRPARWDVFDLGKSGLMPELVSFLESRAGEVSAHSRDETVAFVSEAAMNGHTTLDLRIGALAPADRWGALLGRFARCLFCASAMLLTLATCLHLENTRDNNATKELQTRRDNIYEQVFPGQRPAPGAALRVRSERIKLEGLTRPSGKGPSALGLGGLESLELLAQTVAHIPDNLKISVTEILVDDKGFHLSGRTTSHSAAGQMVQELNTIPDLHVNPPHSKRRSDGTVDFRINAVRRNHEDNP